MRKREREKDRKTDTEKDRMNETICLLFSAGNKKDPVMEEIKKSLPKNVLDATKKGDLKPFQEHIKNMVTDDEIR